MNSLQYCKAKQEPIFTDEKPSVTKSILHPHIPPGIKTEGQWDKNVERGVRVHEEPFNHINHIQYDGFRQIEVKNKDRSADTGVRSSPSNELLGKLPQEKVTAAPETKLSVVHDDDENKYRLEGISTLPNEADGGRSHHLDHRAISQEDDRTVKKDVCLLLMRRLSYTLDCLSRSKSTESTVECLYELAKARNSSLARHGFSTAHLDHKDLWALRNQLLKLFDGKLSRISADEDGINEEQGIRTALIGKMIGNPITNKVVSVLRAVEEDDKFRKLAVANWEKDKGKRNKSPKKKANKQQRLQNEASAGKKRKKVDVDDENGNDDESEVQTKKAKRIENAQIALETEYLLCKQRRLELHSAQRRERLKARERELDRKFDLKKRKLELIKVGYINQQECVQNFASLLSKFGKILLKHGRDATSIPQHSTTKE